MNVKRDIIVAKPWRAGPAMPYTLPIPKRLLAAGWRAKVFDDEGPETPHVTIQYKTEKWWRVSLRSQGLMVPPGGKWSEIPADIRQAVEEHLAKMRTYWDDRNPHNLVEGDDDEHDN
jgi:hypothetical protein